MIDFLKLDYSKKITLFICLCVYEMNKLILNNKNFGIVIIFLLLIMFRYLKLYKKCNSTLWDVLFLVIVSIILSTAISLGLYIDFSYKIIYLPIFINLYEMINSLFNKL